MAQLAFACGSFSGTGNGNGCTPTTGNFNVAISGTFVGTVQLQKNFDNGTWGWTPVSQNATGAAASYTAPVAMQMTEFEQGVSYRWVCTAYTSGTINYRISQ